MGHALWRDRYGADTGVIGSVLRADREEGDRATETFRIVGVLPPDFYFGRDSRDQVDLLVPLTSPARTYMVRLHDAVPPLFAERRITEAARTVASGLPSDWSGVHLESVHGRYVAQLRPVLVGVTIASGLVLIIVCANVAVLVVLRTLRRQKELALRAALGSGRGHLALMLLVEALLLCVAACAVALALTQLALRLLAPLIETQLGRPAPGGTGAITIDGTVLFIIAAAGLAIALSLSFLPLLTPWQHRLGEALRRVGTMGADMRSTRRLRSVLITFEVAGTLILLVGCGLLVRSVVGMLRTDLGFQVEGLVRSRVVLRGADYADAQAFARFYDRFAERVSGVTHSPVVFTSWPPFIERSKQSVEVAGRVGQPATAGAILVSTGYFGTFGIRLLAGREFTAADAATDAEPVAVISETLARRLWPDGSAIGQRIRGVEPTPAGARAGPWRVVVGVVADVRQAYADAEVGDLYLPRDAEGRFGSFYVRTGQSPGLLLGTLRTIAAELDPHAIVDPPRAVASDNRELAGTTFLTAMLTGFAGMAGFLAILGIYGVTAYAVQQRTREIAIRMALGANATAVVRLFLKEGAAVLASGLAFGLVGAIVVGRGLENQLYAVGRLDPSTLATTWLLMAAAGGLATWWPARRASLSSPIVALKQE
jgi:predicted permease